MTTRVPSGLNAADLTEPVWPARVASALPVAASHSRAVLSSDAVTTRVPSGLNAADPDRISVAFQGGERLARWPRPTAARSRSSDAVTTRVPSGLNAAELTPAVWPSRVIERLARAASHSRAVRSSDAVTTRVPSGLNAADQTAAVWPSRVTEHLARAASHSRAVLIIRRRDDPRAVRAERRRPDRSSWPSRVASALPVAASHSRAVSSPGRRDHPRAVRAERRRLTDPCGPPGWRAPCPRPRPTAARCHPETRSPLGAVRAERRRPDRISVAFQRDERLAGGRVPQPRGLSSDAVTTRVPSGLNAAESTPAV